MDLEVDGTDYSKAIAVHKPSGHVIVDGNQIADTVQCVHCGAHWVPIRGSGRVYGFCMNCNGKTCGRKSCHACVTSEKKLEIRESQ